MIPLHSNLQGKTVLIFGGSSGMGKATAKAVASKGGTPWIIGRNESRLREAAKEIDEAAMTTTKWIKH